MWSHYADSHKGVCLTVKISKNLVRPICYSSKRVYEGDNIDEIISSSRKCTKKNISLDYSQLNINKKIAYIKDKKWSDEKEYRIVFDENDENNLIFDNNKWFMPVKITNIYLGANFDNTELTIKRELLSACNHNGIDIAQMVLSETDYSLNVRRINNACI
jgi:hypothetical protein